MRNYFMLVIILFVSSIMTTANAHNDWIPYTVVPTPPVIEVPMVPSVTYSTRDYFTPRPAILTYDWVPYYSTKTLTVERQGLLCKYRTVIQQPCIEWVYQPVWK
jgi:hypothetical protein